LLRMAQDVSARLAAIATSNKSN